MKKIFFLLLIWPAVSFTQENTTDYESGKLQLGVRTVFSSFNNDGYSGLGVGGQFRIKFGNRLNTEWFADYITTNIGNLAKRTDYHIGWAVQFYPLSNIYARGKFIPFVEAGHCFDYTQVKKTNGSNFYLDRWSSAVHAGLGNVFCLSDNVDITLSAKYMLHLGKEVKATIFDAPSGDKDVMVQKLSANLEGHLLIALTVNVLIADLWSREK